MANRPRSLIGRHAGKGIAPGSGGTLDVDLSELDAKTGDPVGADSATIVDSEDSSISKKITFTLIAELLAGVGTASGLAAAVGVLKVYIHGLTEKTTPVVADELLIGDTQDSNKNKRATLTNIIKAISTALAGTNATSSLSEATGVMRVNVGGTTAKTSPALADAVLANDSDDSTNKKITLAKILALVGAQIRKKLVDGTDAGANVTVSGMAVGDVLISVFAMTAKSSIATMADRTADYVVGTGVLTKAAGTDERLNQLIVTYIDCT